MPQGQGEVLFEFTRIGNQVRVSAFDVSTGIEVVVIAPAMTSQPQMQSLALSKLKRRIEQVKKKPAP